VGHSVGVEAGEKKSSLFLRGIEPRFCGRPVISLLIIITEISWLYEFGDSDFNRPRLPRLKCSFIHAHDHLIPFEALCMYVYMYVRMYVCIIMYDYNGKVIHNSNNQVTRKRIGGVAEIFTYS
jgi:hypothetical protein